MFLTLVVWLIFYTFLVDCEGASFFMNLVAISCINNDGERGISIAVFLKKMLTVRCNNKHATYKHMYCITPPEV